jgi:hypothetical protein
MTLTCEHTQIVPLFIQAPGYREWEFTLDGIDFRIINEDGADGDWRLSQWVSNGAAATYRLCGIGSEIDAFLRQHGLTLGN